jgi:sugar phosphate isomerase/epimerase
MCPLPDGLDPAKASPDHFSLSSTDGSERSMAVKAAFVTIDCAARLGAAAVVLHAGRVEIMDRTRQLAGMSTDPGAAKAVRDMMIKERAGKAAPHIESVLRSIDEIIPYAKKAGIAIGLENRYYYREIPTVDEFEAIFARFGREDIYYWHDVGHAEVFERLGLARHEDLLSRFAGRLLGVHLHDIIGNISDHHAPGSGTFDFSMIKRYVRPDTIKVIEAHDQASGTDISNAVSVLSRIL